MCKFYGVGLRTSKRDPHPAWVEPILPHSTMRREEPCVGTTVSTALECWPRCLCLLEPEVQNLKKGSLTRVKLRRRWLQVLVPVLFLTRSESSAFASGFPLSSGVLLIILQRREEQRAAFLEKSHSRSWTSRNFAMNVTLPTGLSNVAVFLRGKSALLFLGAPLPGRWMKKYFCSHERKFHPVSVPALFSSRSSLFIQLLGSRWVSVHEGKDLPIK